MNVKRKATQESSEANEPKKVKLGADLMLSQSFDPEKHDVTGWLMSEKMDGVRAGWDGKTFYSRNGNIFNAPKWFCDAMPANIRLDGELFSGRGEFQNTVGSVKRKFPIDEQWRKIKFHVFDVLGRPQNETFEKRLEFLHENVKPEGIHSSVVIVKHTKCAGNDQVQETLDDIVAKGGEGVMLRQPGSFYEHKRSKTLLKVKKAYDAEALVIGHLQGKGRNEGKCGALLCEMESKQTFQLGSGLTDSDREKPPPIGSIVTYRFNEMTRDKRPRFPRFLRIRPDADKAKDFQ